MVIRNRFKFKQKNKDYEPVELLNKELAKNVNEIKTILDEPDDLIVRETTVGEEEVPVAVVYIEGLINITSIRDGILENLQLKTKDEHVPNDPKQLYDFLYSIFITAASLDKGKSMDDVFNALLIGKTIVCLDGIDEVIIVDTKGGDFRQIEEPITEILIRGPRTGFIENLGTNIALLRRVVADPNLRFKSHQIGRRSKNALVVAYIDGIVNKEIVDEINRRLATIDIDYAPESGYIEEWIEDSFLSPFPQILDTERPDKAAATLMQGRVVILLDGTPFALILPMTFANILQSPEDYYNRWTVGSLLRLLRYLGAFLSIFLPSLYIALVSMHPGMIPTLLVFSIASSREGVPFSATIEALLMIITMELLQEAGARLPQTIGQTIGIVGGLVIGEAAVQAGIVSPIMVVVVALTAIANFAVPSFSIAIGFRIIRFLFMFSTTFLGLFGIILAYIGINIHLVNLKSVGVPYSAPFAPFFKHDWQDLIIRTPIQTVEKRPVLMQTDDDKKMFKGRT